MRTRGLRVIDHLAGTAVVLGLLCNIWIFSCYADPAPTDSAKTDSWVIQAGPIRSIDGSVPMVTGTFQVSGPQSAISSKEELRQGGACLIADLVPFGIGLSNCTTNQDCNQPDGFGAATIPALKEAYGYCVSRGGEPPRCWTRPGPPDKYCRRSIDGLRLTPGEHQLEPVAIDPLRRGMPYPEWAVYACMAHKGHDRECGNPGKSQFRQISVTPNQAEHN